MKFKKSAMTLGLSAFMAFSAIGTTSSVHAFGLDSVKSMVGGENATGGGAVDVDSLVTKQKDLMGRFNIAMQNMLLAQSNVLAAGNLKEQAELASATAAHYATGNVVSKDQLDRDTQLTAENNARIQEIFSQKSQLSEEGRALLLAAVPHYAKGVYEGTKLPDAFSDWSASASGGISSLSSNPMGAASLKQSLGEVVVVTTNLPALISAWGATTRDFVAFAKSNEINVGDVESQLGEL